MRYEQKYIIGRHHVGQVKDLLDHALVPDLRFGMDTVSSLYFDVPTLKSYNEVIDGDIVKEKLRLRWYESTEKGDPVGEDVPVYLEVKSKEGFRGAKRRVGFTVPWEVLNDPIARITDLWDIIRDPVGELGWPLGGTVVPVIVIKYTRERYWDALTGLRLSLDHTLRATSANEKLVNRTMPFHSDQAVMEIKGGLYSWPETLRALEPFGVRRQSISKYATMLYECMDQPYD